METTFETTFEVTPFGQYAAELLRRDRALQAEIEQIPADIRHAHAHIDGYRKRRQIGEACCAMCHRGADRFHEQRRRDLCQQQGKVREALAAIGEQDRSEDEEE